MVIQVSDHDPVFATMRCLGCAAKASHTVLANALEDAVSLAVSNGADPALMPEAGIESDAAIMERRQPDITSFNRSMSYLKLSQTPLCLAALPRFMR